MKETWIIIFFIISLGSAGQVNYDVDSMLRADNVELLMPTFRGSAERNYYGWGSLKRLDVIWKFYLGEGITVIGRKSGQKKWKGAGWTGQPLVIKEGQDTFLIQGSYDHSLRKIHAQTGKEIWKYSFDDVVKGTGTLWVNRNAVNRENALIIMQGSRLGTHHFLDADFVPSFRAISYFTAKELWRMNSRLTKSYSRDVDASPLILSDTAYLGLENGIFTVFNPDPAVADSLDYMLQPLRYENHYLYQKSDISTHGGNLVTESSPALLRNKIYLASGSGHIYGYNIDNDSIDWDFFIGSDIDGTIVVTKDSCLLISVEKQYITGKGGVFKLNPSKPPENSVEWYFPVGDTAYSSWEGGVIGTVGINENYTKPGSHSLVAISALDGFSYVVYNDSVSLKEKVKGPHGEKTYPTPVLHSRLETGPSISSPVFSFNNLIVCSYNGIYLYSIEDDEFVLLDRFGVAVESSPVFFGNRLYIASRNGYLYCLGEK